MLLLIILYHMFCTFFHCFQDETKFDYCKRLITILMSTYKVIYCYHLPYLPIIDAHFEIYLLPIIC